MRRDGCSNFCVCSVCSVPAVLGVCLQASLCHLNVQIIVRDSKPSDGNDYGVENNRFPVATADCWLVTLSQSARRGWWLFSTLWTSSGKMAEKHQWNEKLKSTLKEKWNLETFCSDKWSSSVIWSCSVIGWENPDRLPDCLSLVTLDTDTIKMFDIENWISFIKSLRNPMVVLILPRLVYLICLYLVLQHLFPASPLMIRLGACLGGVGMHVSCWIGFLSGTVSMQCGDAISVKTCSSMEPCQPTMESSITQSAAGQSPLPLSQDWNIHRLI